ncbi:NAD(P)H-binding protein [Bailinhaonella thermotolerans]|uniref:NAD-dependent epimerase/dehydratase family protein n=1 Tax=Bailinhaonella thermotolerans TaxID=1070861 RepID=A0A3A4A7T6_9ACTN|nr:NAD(P)H-binding protein [Bailinhaonella thermotolerans]RJL23999.1 NAD-dependent epimerase/dehydratase family protein [Bailinhaonella thermotolerans]
MIVVTGATGTVGSEVTRLLAGRGEPVRVMTREPSKVAALPAVEVVRGDFDDPGSLAGVARGAEAVFLLSAPGPWVPRHDEAMIAAARAAGVRKVVKVSAIGTGEEHEGAKVGGWHLAGEQELRSSGLEWTILRPSSFASNVLRWVPQVRAGQPVPNTTGQGRQGVIDPRDVAEVAVTALTSDEHVRTVLTLTGPELLSVPDMAKALGETLGRVVETVDVPLEVYRTQMIAAGVDPEFADVAVNGSRMVAQDGNARLTPDVERVLGRAPRTFLTWATDHSAAFTLG